MTEVWCLFDLLWFQARWKCWLILKATWCHETIECSNEYNNSRRESVVFVMSQLIWLWHSIGLILSPMDGVQSSIIVEMVKIWSKGRKRSKTTLIQPFCAMIWSTWMDCWLGVKWKDFALDGVTFAFWSARFCLAINWFASVLWSELPLCGNQFVCLAIWSAKLWFTLFCILYGVAQRKHVKTL